MENRRRYNNRKCALCGIRQLPKSTTFLSSFPLDPVRCRLWVKATGDEDLVHLPIEKLHELKNLCGKHFTPECFNKKGNRLLKTAVPTESLTRPLLSEDCLREFPLHVKSFYDMEKTKLRKFVAKKPEVASHDPLEQKIDIKINEENDIHNIQDIIEVIKIETADDVDLPDDVGLPDDYDTPAAQPEDLETILGSDDGADKGFCPFVRPSSAYMLPAINMFAVMEFIASNEHYSSLDYRKLKDLVARKGHDKLLSGLLVQSRAGRHRVRAAVHLQPSAQCALEYDVDTHTVTRSECMACPLARCPHAAALLLWLLAVSNTKIYDTKFVADDSDTSTGSAQHVHDGGDTKVKIELEPQPAVSVRVGAPGLEDPLAEAPGPGDPEDEDEAQLVDEEKPGPSTAKRKKMPLPKVTPRYTATISKTKSVPRETNEDTDDSIIKCSFTRKCFFDVWRSTTGTFSERVEHTRTIMKQAFRDPEYVIDFQPLERRLELLCRKIKGYWNVETDKQNFESKYVEWLAVTEYIEMMKQRRVINQGPREVFKKRILTQKI